MSARLVLHIGANKTGSSAVQAFLRMNYKVLGTRGVLVPDRELRVSNKITGEHVFAFQELFNAGNRVELQTRLTALLQEDTGTVICSAENLSNGANFQFFSKILSGTDCKILLYIRRQDELITSSWQQWSSKTETDFDAWIVLALQRLGHWQRCIEGWENVVGAGNVIVRVFQRSDLAKGDVVDDLIQCLELGEPEGGFVRSPKTVNPSYSDLITPIVSGNKLIFEGEHDNKFYDMIGNLTGDFYVTQKRVSLISRIQREKVIEFYRAENETICRRYFPKRERLFEAVDHNRYEYLTKDELTKRQFEFLSALIFALYNRRT